MLLADGSVNGGKAGADGPEDGAVDRDTVIRILKEQGVGIQMEGETAMLSKGMIFEAQNFPPMVHRCVLQYLSRRYDLNYLAFYYPQLLRH